ncbi:glycosyltransferase family 2 protein [Microscilla marina]|uniref:Dolichol phosphate mannosyltransferase or dolichol phosphate beta glucosyltrandferase n=1 Tax=Microscilla marina ATCC 23134 TaxID=313606 RepID=A1ZL18_MICM2|nr:dolichol phosphate mannosyltransferase or dolichol phosphate beta glucosyltrandferase [Microscilla marina ATCC 23134]
MEVNKKTRKRKDQVKSNIIVIIPAYNEEASIAKVIADIPKGLAEEVIVVNNNSTDRTAEMAQAAGATVLNQRQQGYGAACLKGIAYAREKKMPPEIVVFIDGDYSDFPQQMPDVLAPIIEQDIDMVIGSRALGQRQKGAMMPQQIFGNWLATRLIRLFYGMRFTDLGPFRAIKFHKLLAIGMKDEDYGWTVEMQLKAAKYKLKVTEVPVDYKKRIGVSKVSGTIKGTFMAGYKILWTIFRYL